jgi:hypothetical protein
MRIVNRSKASCDFFCWVCCSAVELCWLVRPSAAVGCSSVGKAHLLQFYTCGVQGAIYALAATAAIHSNDTVKIVTSTFAEH